MQEIIEAYRARGAARDQNELVQLLREAQAVYGGVLPQTALDDIAAALGLKRTFLDAVLKRYPSIKTEAARHTLAVCCGKNCAKRDALADFVREEYGVQQIRPGITGWAQIHGRDELEIDKKAALDAYYLRHLGPVIDLKCFFGTFLAVFRQDGVVEGGTGAMKEGNGETPKA